MRVPHAVQRDTMHRVRDRYKLRALGDPGSAAHHFASLMLRRARDTSAYDPPASSRKLCTASNSFRRFFSMMIVCVPSASCT